MGVSLVGFSGSLVKDVVKNDLMTFLDPNTTETSEATKVVLGKSHLTKLSAHPSKLEQVSSSSCSLSSCQ